MVEAETREEDKRMRKTREEKAKREAEASEGMRAWAKAEAIAKAEIARIFAEASERPRQEQRRRSSGLPPRRARRPRSRPR